MTLQVGGVLGMFDVNEMVAPGSGVARLEKLIVALEARVAELENRLAAGFPQGVTTTSVSSTIRISTCPKCLVTTQHNETGNILTSMPPQTEMQCRVCKHRWGIL